MRRAAPRATIAYYTRILCVYRFSYYVQNGQPISIHKSVYKRLDIQFTPYDRSILLYLRIHYTVQQYRIPTSLYTLIAYVYVLNIDSAVCFELCI
jgi:hypothetical protein